MNEANVTITKYLANSQIPFTHHFAGSTGTVVAKSKIRTRRVDKGKSGQAQKTAVSGGFGGGILSHDLKQTLTLLGEQSDVCERS